MKTFVLAVISLSLVGSVARAAPDASDEANRAMAEAMAAVGSAKALAPPAPSASARVPERDRAQDSGCSMRPGNTSSWLLLLVALVALRRAREPARTLGVQKAASNATSPVTPT